MIQGVEMFPKLNSSASYKKNGQLNYPSNGNPIQPNHNKPAPPQSYVTLARLILLITMTCLVLIVMSDEPVQAKVLMRVCDTREIKTVTSRVCMLYKRTKNSGVKLDRQGNMRIAREVKGDYSPARLAIECCKVGCPPHIFAYNC